MDKKVNIPVIKINRNNGKGLFPKIESYNCGNLENDNCSKTEK